MVRSLVVTTERGQFKEVRDEPSSVASFGGGVHRGRPTPGHLHDRGRRVTS